MADHPGVGAEGAFVEGQCEKRLARFVGERRHVVIEARHRELAALVDLALRDEVDAGHGVLAEPLCDLVVGLELEDLLDERARALVALLPQQLGGLLQHPPDSGLVPFLARALLLERLLDHALLAAVALLELGPDLLPLRFGDELAGALPVARLAVAGIDPDVALDGEDRHQVLAVGAAEHVGHHENRRVRHHVLDPLRLGTVFGGGFQTIQDSASPDLPRPR